MFWPFFVLSLLTISSNAEKKSVRSPAFECTTIENSKSCSAFNGKYSYPSFLFKNVDEFDALIVDQVQQQLDHYKQKCWNGNQLKYLDGTTTQVCLLTLSQYWRAYGCGEASPKLCKPQCLQWVNAFNSAVEKCWPVGDPIRQLNATAECNANDGRCVEASGATSVHSNILLLTIAVMLLFY